jgi:hypothetical protein
MNEIKTRRQRTFFGIVFPDKNTYMEADRFRDQMHYDEDYRCTIIDTKITLEKVFENEAYLAINHWVGVFRITYVNDWEEIGVRAGDYDQYVVDTAAGKDDALEKLQRKVLDTLEENDIDPENNWIDLDLPPWKVKTKSYKLD